MKIHEILNEASYGGRPILRQILNLLINGMPGRGYLFIPIQRKDIKYLRQEFIDNFFPPDVVPGEENLDVETWFLGPENLEDIGSDYTDTSYILKLGDFDESGYGREGPGVAIWDNGVP